MPEEADEARKRPSRRPAKLLVRSSGQGGNYHVTLQVLGVVRHRIQFTDREKMITYAVLGAALETYESYFCD